MGNFPQRLEFKTGTLEVVEFEDGKRALKASSPSEFVIPLPEVLPDKYTIELDVTNRGTKRVGANTIEVTGAPSFSDRDAHLKLSQAARKPSGRSSRVACTRERRLVRLKASGLTRLTANGRAQVSPLTATRRA